MPSRPKHPKKDLEPVLRWAEKQGWTVTKRANRYFKMYCPCPDKHLKTVKISPSNPRYKRELLNELKRSTCWKEEEN